MGKKKSYKKRMQRASEQNRKNTFNREFEKEQERRLREKAEKIYRRRVKKGLDNLPDTLLDLVTNPGPIRLPEETDIELRERVKGTLKDVTPHRHTQSCDKASIYGAFGTECPK